MFECVGNKKNPPIHDIVFFCRIILTRTGPCCKLHINIKTSYGNVNLSSEPGCIVSFIMHIFIHIYIFFLSIGNAELGNEYVVFSRLPHHTSYDEENVSALLPRPPTRGCRVIDINVRKYSRYYRKRLYKPQRRLLPEGVDDVFESEDSAGSRSLRLHTIPERSDSDIDDVLNADKKLSNTSDKDAKNDESVNEACVNSGKMSSLSKCSTSSIEHGEGSQKDENDKDGSYVCLKDSGSDIKNTLDLKQINHNTETENRKHSLVSSQEKEDI